MAHIKLSNELPGIIGLMKERPDTGKPLNELTEVLLQKDDELSSAERELIAAHVSGLNSCSFCANTHLNVCFAHQNMDPQYIDVNKAEIPTLMQIRPVVRALLDIAEKVQQDGKKVTAEDIQKARELGATDYMIHDAVLISAAFCMFNRYVDGLATFTPQDENFYGGVGKMLAKDGYLNAIK